MSSGDRASTLRTASWIVFVLACAANLWGLYAPSQPGPTILMFPGFDKVAHLLSFALVMAAGVVTGLRPVVLAGVLLVHAGASELVQHLWLDDRSGDLADLVADVAGIALGWWAGHAVTRRRAVPSASEATRS